MTTKNAIDNRNSNLWIASATSPCLLLDYRATDRPMTSVHFFDSPSNAQIAWSLFIATTLFTEKFDYLLFNGLEKMRLE